MLGATLSFATPPAPDTPDQAQLKSTIDKVLLKPLAAREARQSRFSRVRMPPDERRVRVLDAQPQKDAEGNEFVAFAVDSKSGWAVDDTDTPEEWLKDAITGCGYVGSGELFVKRGDSYYASALMLGKKTRKADKQICVAAQGEVATAK